MSRSIPHESWVQDSQVFLANEEDGYYSQQFKSWEEIEEFIAKLRATATEAWGLPNSQASLADRAAQTGLTPGRNP